MKTNLKVLALLFPEETIQKLLLDSEDVDICYVYNAYKQNLFSRCIRRLKFLLPFDSLVFSDDYITRDISGYDVIILDETIFPDRIIKNIRKRNNHCKLIYWMWNTVEHTTQMKLYDRWKKWNQLLAMRAKYKFQISSFDEGDCKKYGLVYNNQVAPYFKDISIPDDLSNSIFFYGLDKGRLTFIKHLYDTFTNKGYQCNFNVVPDAHKKYDEFAFEKIHEEYFRPYKDIIEQEVSSKALLEILQKGQKGITWRALESLFYKKKLITNFKEIKQYDFYNPNNIFVLGMDDMNQFDLFMRTKFENISDKEVIKYTFKGWLSNMLKE